jgi:hypothetical protein
VYFLYVVLVVQIGTSLISKFFWPVTVTLFINYYSVFIILISKFHGPYVYFGLTSIFLQTPEGCLSNIKHNFGTDRRE